MKNKINFIYYILGLILILILIDSSSNHCNNKSEPILLKEGNVCVMRYCTEEDFKNNICIIDNVIIRTQWLNNIIIVGEENCRFTKIAKYSNGDMIAISQINPGKSLGAYFYGLKENGRPLFTKNGKETPYNPLNNYTISNYISIEYGESEILIVKNETNGKENLLILGRLFQFIELYNFDNKTIDSQQSLYNIYPFFSNNYIINNTRGSLINLKDSNYFLYGGIFSSYIFTSNNNYLILYKLYCERKVLINKYSSEIIKIYGNMTSCFETEDGEYIYCFYMKSLSEKEYKIIIFDKNLNKKSAELTIESNFIEANIFFKCIHYRGDKGIFTYYDKIDNEGPYPILLFKTKDDEDVINWNSLNKTKIKSYLFEYNIDLNDIIKISNDVICFASISKEKEILYIVIINIFDNESKLKIRYYLIRTFELYNYKFYLDLRLNIIKNSIALTSSYCNQINCENRDIHYSSLIIFSYPNSTDYSKNIIDELFEKNEILDNLIFDLNFRNIVIIENNIFGLIYSKIIIKTIENCDNIELISSTKNSSITIDYELEKEEDINITFKNNDIFNCSIGYLYEITEPDYEEFEKYPEKIDITYGNDNEIFNDFKKTYSGRLSYYNLYLNDKLTNNCLNDCGLCYDNTEKACIVCNYNYTIRSDINGIKNKTCLDKEIEETEKYSDILENLDDKSSHTLIDKPSDKPSDKPNNKPNDKPSDKPNNKPSDKQTDINDKIIKTFTDRITDKSIDKSIIENSNVEIDCTIEEIISSQCINNKVKDEQYSDLYNQFKDRYLKKDTYHGENKKVKTENVALELTNTDNQDENDPSISFIDLGKCEEILKNIYSIPKDESLIIYKSDIKTLDLTRTYVNYEIFNPMTLEPLDYLTHCSKEKISISIPINLNNNTKYLYNNLNSSGYNLFDTNDSFYNDICATYTTEKGTDMSLKDRQEAINNNGTILNFCQVGCTIAGFNNMTQKAKCNCNIQETKKVTNINDILFPTELLTNIFEGFKYSNYLVMKCYKLIFDFELIKKNIGFIFMMIIFISLLILLFIYIINGRNKIKYYIKAVLNNKSVYIKNRKSIKKDSIKTVNNKIPIINNSKKKKNKNKKFSLIIHNNNKINSDKNIKTKKKSFEPVKKTTTKNKKSINNPEIINSFINFGKSNEKLKNEINNLSLNIIPIHNFNYTKNKNTIKKNINNLNLEKTKKKSISLYKLNYKNNKNEQKLKKNEKQKKILDLDYVNYKTLNIQELNNLEYEVALLVDKRTFIQYYCSLIKKNQLIIFTFIPIDDYNLLTLKISSFLLQLSLYIASNAFFFSDSTMHQIYTDNGDESFLCHIPQIIYSSLISTVINTLLRQLCLSENDILSIKMVRSMKISIKKANEVKVYLRIKIIIFFIMSFLLTIFIWYFISCFCAVYTNTQIILIKDSLLSFGLSMVYPFGLNLIPTIFRISALRSKNQSKLCLYKISQLLSSI